MNEYIRKQDAIDLIDSMATTTANDLRDILRLVCKHHELVVSMGGLITDRCNYVGKEIPKGRIWARCDSDCPFLRLLKGDEDHES